MEAYLQSQLNGIAELKEAVEEQAAQIERASASVSTVQGLNRNRKSFNSRSSPTTKLPPAALPSQALSTAHAPDETEGLPSMARRREREGKVDIPITDEERAVPNSEWVSPTPEEVAELQLTKPWMASMTPPSDFSFNAISDAKPNATVRLDHVYGYRTSNVRNNVKFVDAETVVYYSACIGLSHNLTTNAQLHFTEHEEDIVSMAVHRGEGGRCIVATGDMGPYPVVYVWDASTGEVLAKLSGQHRRAVVAVAFSEDGSRLATVGMDDGNTVVLYEWESGKVVGQAESGPNQILDITANTTRTATPNAEFVSVGVGAVLMWKCSGIDGHLTYEQADLTGDDLPPSVIPADTVPAYLCVRCTPDYTLVGSADGVLLQLRGARLFQSLVCHSAALTSIVPVGLSSVITAGHDGFLCRWSLPCKSRVGSIDINQVEDPQAIRRHANSIRALDSSFSATNSDGYNNPTLIVGTACGTLNTCHLPAGTSSTSKTLIKNVLSVHYSQLESDRFDGEVGGLAVSPLPPSAPGPLPNSDLSSYLLTCGEDATLRLYNYTTHTQLIRHILPVAGQCVTFAPNVTTVAVGLQNGTVVVYEISFNKRTKAPTFQEVATTRRTARRIQCIRYSPCGKFLAAGHADNGVDIYTVNGSVYSFLGRLSGCSGVVMQLDFSEDSKFIQVCTQTYELWYFEIDTLKAVDGNDAKDVKWSSFSTILGWDVQGVWHLNSNGSEVNAVSRSPDSSLLAVAEDGGSIRLFKYPCIGGGMDSTGLLHRRPDSLRLDGHSEHVSAVAWGGGGNVLFTVGGLDRCCMQWKVTPTTPTTGDE